MKENKPANAWHNVRGVTYEEMREAEETVLRQYGDILNAERPVDPARRKASANSRAAQFLPFAALTGFEEEIAEEGRLTEARTERSDEQNDRLDRMIRIAESRIREQPEVTAVYFEEDPRKQGGAYIAKRGSLKKIDAVNGVLIFTDKTCIQVSDLADLRLHEEEEDIGE